MTSPCIKQSKKEIDSKERRRLRRIERDPLHQGLIVERSKLKARDFSLNLKTLLGKTQIIGNATVLSQQAGFYCSVCECLLKDSITYLDHINGKWHQRALGISMRVEKNGADSVRARIKEISKNKKRKSTVLVNHNILDNSEKLKEHSKIPTESKKIKILNSEGSKLRKMQLKSTQRDAIAMKMGWNS